MKTVTTILWHSTQLLGRVKETIRSLEMVDTDALSQPTPLTWSSLRHHVLRWNAAVDMRVCLKTHRLLQNTLATERSGGYNQGTSRIFKMNYKFLESL